MPLSAFHPGDLWLDNTNTHINAHGGGILYHEGTYYWFGEHKIAGPDGNRAHVGVHVYASRDLYNWEDKGIALAVEKDPHNEITAGSVIERPKVLFNKKTGTFVMWFHLEVKGMHYSAARSGVAISTSPAGPYVYLGSMRPNAGVWPRNVAPEGRILPTPAEVAQMNATYTAGGPCGIDFPANGLFGRDYACGQMARDMNLFQDDDGSAYHIFASENNGTIHISKLTDDFRSHSGEYVRALHARYHEGPALFKHNGRYFMFSSDCTGWAPNAGRLSTAPSIWGPWTELANPCRGTPAQCANTFESQSTFVLPVAGRNNAYIFMGDRWRPQNPIDGRYVWLPVTFESDTPTIRWHGQWDLSVFSS